MLGLGPPAVTATYPGSGLPYSSPGPPSPYAPSVPTVGPGFAQPPYRPGVAALYETSLSSGRPFEAMTRAPSGFELPGTEPRVVSLGGMNRFLCIALDTEPTAWSGGWTMYPSGERKLVIGRPFIEEGLERLPEVGYVIQSSWFGTELIRTGEPERFTEKWTELLSSADDAELSQMSYAITVPRSSIALFTLEVIDEVAGLHERGRIHGDIKPSNILVSRNDTLLID